MPFESRGTTARMFGRILRDWKHSVEIKLVMTINATLVAEVGTFRNVAVI